MVKKLTTSKAVSVKYRKATDGQTDGQTDTIAISILRVSILTRDKNYKTTKPINTKI